MKLSELERLQLENIGLKLNMLQNQSLLIQQEVNKLHVEKENLFKTFAEANGIEISKMSIDISTGDVSLIENKTEV